ncbi:restriction endonuclease subunit S [Idiomarina sp. UBA4520]|jgi:type I restriction enzyme S subunit|uniref:restriction endonuclease subunit S n=1 Tax=Idiomarina sp. UBA4520 TaxID=1946647 RepID=UPI000B2129A3|nr:restriction endonuclease subunit S [Idiomarina sp. UBA4520]MBF38983.1 restriction endonuclease subunit S [Idiomarinaceae bacterium]|tara:strand:+ start:49322 stop:50497 length:1176 start_codon:yes stop_codon:yes gene_type:complete
MGWEMVKIRDVCEVISGQSPKGQYYNDKGEGLPFYQGKKEFGTRFIGPPQKWTTNITKEAFEGDILMSVRAPVGPVNFATQKVCIGRGLAAIRPGDNIDRNFLFYYLLSIRDEIQGSEGAVFASINRKQIEALETPLISIEEQRRIVAILDEAFADIDKARALAERNLENARELFASYLRTLFKTRQHRWNLFKFREVCDFVRGPFGGSLKKSSFQTTGYAVYEQQHAINNQFSDIRYFVDKKKFQDMARFQLRPGDLIVSCSGTMGRIAIAPDNLCEGIINQALLRLTPSNKIKSEFLKLWMESPNFQEEIEVRAQGAAIRNMASVKILKELDIPIPNMSEQEEIIKLSESMLVRAESLITNYESKLAALTDLKKSLLQKAFTGELTKAA